MLDHNLLVIAKAASLREKQSFLGEALLGAGVGAPLGAAMAPPGRRMEGFGRGVARGGVTGAGMGVGGLLGSLAGTAAGGGFSSDLHAGATPGDNPLQNPKYVLALLSALGGGAAGAGLGGLAGYHLGGKAIGKPSWEAGQDKKPINDKEKKAAAILSVLGRMPSKEKTADHILNLIKRAGLLDGLARTGKAMLGGAARPLGGAAASGAAAVGGATQLAAPPVKAPPAGAPPPMGGGVLPQLGGAMQAALRLHGVPGPAPPAGAAVQQVPPGGADVVEHIMPRPPRTAPPSPALAPMTQAGLGWGVGEVPTPAPVAPQTLIRRPRPAASPNEIPLPGGLQSPWQPPQ